MIFGHNGFTSSAPSLLLLGLGLAPLAAQEPPSSLFVDRVDVQVVNIEAFVFDKKGSRVTGLTRGDFEVLEDGRPVELTNFFAVDRDRRVESSPEPGRTTDKQSSPAETPPGVQHPISLVVYIDHFNLRPSSRNRAIRNIEGFLQGFMGNGDRVMLVGAFLGAEAIQPFTGDWVTVASSLNKMRKAATHRQVDEAALLRTIKSMTLNDDPRDAYQHLRSYVESAQSELRRSTGLLRDTVRSLSGLPGRKSLMYVSEGLPQRPGEGLYAQIQEIFDSRQLRTAGLHASSDALGEDQTSLFEEIVREANAHQVTFYTLDASGPTTMGLSAATGGAAIVGNAGPTAFAHMRKANLQEPLSELAEATGGTAILGTFNFDKVLDRLADDFDSFYSLGYSPADIDSNRYRRIEVRVKPPGLVVRHRSGYVAKTAAELMADRTLSSLLLDVDKNPLEIQVDFGSWEKSGRNKFRLPVLVRVPFSKVTLVPNGPSYSGRLRLYVAVKDQDGAVSDVQQSPYPIKVPAARLEEALDKEIGHLMTLVARGGPARIAVGVWDELSGIDSIVHQELLLGEE
ncbi:MAG: VWA domain-containing protein [Acidobacteriota bacterium]|nr:VWA domain-containing protein [Acidobacteriota bacterium]